MRFFISKYWIMSSKESFAVSVRNSERAKFSKNSDGEWNLMNKIWKLLLEISYRPELCKKELVLSEKAHGGEYTRTWSISDGQRRLFSRFETAGSAVELNMPHSSTPGRQSLKPFWRAYRWYAVHILGQKWKYWGTFNSSGYRRQNVKILVIGSREREGCNEGWWCVCMLVNATRSDCIACICWWENFTLHDLRKWNLKNATNFIFNQNAGIFLVVVYFFASGREKFRLRLRGKNCSVDWSLAGDRED